ncbi:MAG TPA: DUF559 domain-containing protein [Acidimicrobiales bacterium]|nr:DUF559 domain-containing protein [Acidimicrobiales bacterium]
MKSADRRALETAARQFGAVSQEQLQLAGLTNRQIRDRVTGEELIRFGVRALAFAGSADVFERRAMCVLLEFPGGSLSFPTAAAHFGVTGYELEPIHVSVPRRTRPRTIDLDVVVHRPLYLPEHHLTQFDNGLVFTTPTRTAADIANLPTTTASRAERVVETLWAARLTDRTRLARMAGEWCERGRRGSAFLHAFLDARPAEWLPPESNLERRFIKLIADAGMPRPRSQVDSGGEDWFGRVDLRDPELPLIAEIDSDRFHAAPLDRASDAARDEAAERAGFTVERFREHDVWHNPSDVIARWRAARLRVRSARPDAGT